MKKLINTCLLLCYVYHLSAQIINQGANIIIKKHTTLFTSEEVQNVEGGTLLSQGTLITESSISNSAESILSGRFILDRNLINQGSLENMDITFTGNHDSEIQSNGATIQEIKLLKSAHAELSLIDDLSIDKLLDFQSSNLLRLGDQHLNFIQNAEISGYSKNSYIITDGQGKVVLENSDHPFFFPIGKDENSYNPIFFENADSENPIKVRIVSAPEVFDDNQHTLAIAWNIETKASELLCTTFWQENQEIVSISPEQARLVSANHSNISTSIDFKNGKQNNSIQFQSILKPLEFNTFYTINEAMNYADNRNIAAKHKKSISIKFYPNPATAGIYIELFDSKQEYKIELIDILGKSIFKEQISVKSVPYYLDFSDKQLSPGTYLLNIVSENGAISTSKLIIHQKKS